MQNTHLLYQAITFVWETNHPTQPGATYANCLVLLLPYMTSSSEFCQTVLNLSLGVPGNLIRCYHFMFARVQYLFIE